MKKLLVVLAALALVAGLSSISYAQVITGTVHDMSGQGWNTSGEICIVCHTPHNAIAGEQPLWNQLVTLETFDMYDSDTLDNAIAVSPQGVSKLCLSCHDGVTIMGGSGSAMSSSVVGTDLTQSHPVSVTYDDTVDTGLKVIPDTTLVFYGGGDQVECATCHNPHDGQFGNFLRVTNATSGLCLTCHNK